MTTLYLDIETYNTEPITRGSYRYAETAEVMVLAWALDDAPAQVVDTSAGFELRDLPAPLFRALTDASVRIVAHNVLFDRTVLTRAPMTRNLHAMLRPINRWHCTMAQALAHSLPGGLDKLCGIFGVSDDVAKDKAGKQLVQLFCKPRPKNMKVRRATRDTHPVEWARFLDYARRDVEAMRAVHKRLPTWNYGGENDNAKRERAFWQVDIAINDRGFNTDTALIAGAIDAVAKAQRENAARVSELTLGCVSSATKRDVLLKHLLTAYGVALPDLTADTIARRIEDENLPADVRELLALRDAASTGSVAKYKRLAHCVNTDGRMRGTLLWCGASRTGRESGRNFQPQNLPRTPKALKHRVEPGIEAMQLGCLDLVDDDVMGVASAAIRGCVIPTPGKLLRVADLSNIEGRMLAWLAGEDWKTAAFARGDDLYILGYARSFGVQVEAVVADEKAGGNWRLIGKVQELALGYQGSTGAFRSMAALYGVDVTEERALEIVRAWRKANSRIVAFWYDVEKAARGAVQQPGTRIALRGLVMHADKTWLRIKLPSGRILSYLQPQVDEDGQLSYVGVDHYTRQWKRIPTYGGKLVENITQACARDVLRDGIIDATAAGYEIVLHVHDEIVAETPENSALDHVALGNIMATPREWCKGLPLAAAGYSATRYRKG